MCTYNRHATNKIGYTLVVNYQVIPAENLSEIPLSLCMSGDYVIILVHHKDILIDVYINNYVVYALGVLHVFMSHLVISCCIFVRKHTYVKVAKTSLQGT